jgi:hypothetical protein
MSKNSDDYRALALDEQREAFRDESVKTAQHDSSEPSTENAGAAAILEAQVGVVPDRLHPPTCCSRLPPLSDADSRRKKVRRLSAERVRGDSPARTVPRPEVRVRLARSVKLDGLRWELLKCH